MQVKPRLSPELYAQGILKGDRIVLGQAITLIESNLASDQQLAAALLELILPHTGKSMRIGVTGVPGVGKSTFIEAFGQHILQQGKRLAVLTIDPSSQLTRGSILGDKTRMEALSKSPHAFIRPSAAGQALGGVTHKTREALLLCEAAGYDTILIETVGVGQSEVAVKSMVDFFLLLALTGAGDELQGIKKGILEMADAIAVTKADGDNLKRAAEAKTDYQRALHLSAPHDSAWQPVVMTTSAFTGSGFDEIWKTITTFYERMTDNGALNATRSLQQVAWFKDHFQYLISNDIDRSVLLHELSATLEHDVQALKLSAPSAAKQLMEAYRESIRRKA
jgi:LAO/AO transport system kinase